MLSQIDEGLDVLLLNSLPDGVLKIVLQHVSLKDRLTSCSLVNKRLRAAAVAATDQLSFGPCNQFRREARFVEYLNNYGKHVTRLHMDSISGPIWMLPCPNLKDLSLSECDVLFVPGDFRLQGVIPGCTKLTRLKFLGTILDAADENAAVELNILSRLVHLQHLELMPLIPTKGCTLSVPTLPRLGHLTHLNVHKLSAENLTQLGALTKLQELELSANITPVGPSTVPGLTFPASLTKLVLGSGTAVEAAVLSILPVGLQHLAIECEVEGPGSFLAGMARLQCLTHLDLSSPQQIKLGPVGPAYAALTASSKLVEFKLLAGLLPEDAWRYMFHEAGMLPNLTSLIICDENFGASQTVPAPWGISDLWGVVRHCPNLCELPHVYLQHGDHVSYLQKLTGVTSVTLWYGGGYVEDVDESIEGLAAVAHLRDLTVYLYSLSEITVDVLLPLTSLTALTDLKVVCSEADDPSDLDADGSDTGSEANLVFEVDVEQVRQSGRCLTPAEPYAM